MLRCVGRDRPVAPGDDGPTAGTEHGALDLTFQRIYLERFEDVERWVRALGGRSPDIADLVHDIFIVVYRRLAQFEEQNLAGWLYQITRRKMRDYRRLSWVKHLFTERTASTLEYSVAGGGIDQLKQLENHERSALMDRILDTLPAEQRAAFVLFEIEGLSGAEIAQLQRVALNTVWGRIHKARRKLQSRLLASREVTKVVR